MPELNSEPYHYRRSWSKVALHWLRRGHLYAGLIMLPWVVLYGVTAFLFNHPKAFSDQPAVSFGAADLVGTPMEHLPTPAELADQVVEGLRERTPTAKYEFTDRESARYTREFAFATTRADGKEISLLFDVNGSGGSIRSKDVAVPKKDDPAPFAVGRAPRLAKQGDAPDREKIRTGDALTLVDPLHERVKSAVPVVLERNGFACGEVTVTSVPDLSFALDADGTAWRVTYNAQAGTVSGKKLADESPTDLSTRRFLLRLHLAHGYPGEPGVRTAWAVMVDAMAAIMLFWSVSGLFMWWQIKATRRVGAIVLLLSLSAAAWVGFAMHGMLMSG